MKKQMLLFILILCLTPLRPEAEAQIKRYIKAPYVSFEYTSKKAAMVWWFNWLYNSQSLKDTSVWLGIGEEFYTIIKDTLNKELDVKVRLMAIRGRGDHREALVQLRAPAWSYPDDWNLYQWDEDSGYVYVGRTTDSTIAYQEWVGYTPRDYEINLYTDSTYNRQKTNWFFGPKFKNVELVVGLDKVVGNPLLNNGNNQLALLRFYVRESPTSEWKNLTEAFFDTVTLRFPLKPEGATYPITISAGTRINFKSTLVFLDTTKYFDGPGLADSIFITFRAYDADASAEASFWVNADSLVLFGSQYANSNDKIVKDIEYYTPGTWWKNGVNDFKFNYLATAGCRIDTMFVRAKLIKASLQ